MTTYTISSHTADEWREMADTENRRSAESFDRCDTDGFLSQWAHDSLARTYRQLAAYVESGGDEQEIPWLFVQRTNATGDLDTWEPAQEWEWVSGRFRPSVRVFHEGRVRWFNESEAKKGRRREDTDTRKGYAWGTVRARVDARTYAAGMTVGLALHPVTDDHGSIVEVLSIGGTANYPDREA